mgnify:CR=1 FL=1
MHRLAVGAGADAQGARRIVDNESSVCQVALLHRNGETKRQRFLNPGGKLAGIFNSGPGCAPEHVVASISVSRINKVAIASPSVADLLREIRCLHHFHQQHDIEFPGYIAGDRILSGDVILSFDGSDVGDTRELVRIVGNSDVGKAVRVVVFRDGQTQTLLVTLGRREDAEAAIPASAPADIIPENKDILGLTIAEMSDELRQELGLDENADGLVVADVASESQAFDKGLRAGDVITEAGQQKVLTILDLEERIADAQDAGRKSLLLLVRRAGDPRFVALALD